MLTAVMRKTSASQRRRIALRESSLFVQPLHGTGRLLLRFACLAGGVTDPQAYRHQSPADSVA